MKHHINSNCKDHRDLSPAQLSQEYFARRAPNRCALQICRRQRDEETYINDKELGTRHQAMPSTSPLAELGLPYLELHVIPPAVLPRLIFMSLWVRFMLRMKKILQDCMTISSVSLNSCVSRSPPLRRAMKPEVPAVAPTRS